MNYSRKHSAPSISTGVFGYPVKEAATVVAKVLTSYKAKTLKIVYICTFNDEDFKKYKEALPSNCL